MMILVSNIFKFSQIKLWNYQKRIKMNLPRAALVIIHKAHKCYEKMFDHND